MCPFSQYFSPIFDFVSKYYLSNETKFIKIDGDKNYELMKHFSFMNVFSFPSLIHLYQKKSLGSQKMHKKKNLENLIEFIHKRTSLPPFCNFTDLQIDFLGETLKPKQILKDYKNLYLSSIFVAVVSIYWIFNRVFYK